MPRDYTASSALVMVLLWFFLVQPAFFPKFTIYQFSEDLYYTEQTEMVISISPPPEDKIEIVQIKVDGGELTSTGEMAGSKALEIPFNNLKMGENHHRVRFYGRLWKENFETRLNIVSFPKEYQKPLEAEFVFIPPGEFLMGIPETEAERDDDETLHKVRLTKGFYMQTTEVTQGQWRTIMGNNPSSFKACGDDCPVENVSWNHVQEFIKRLNRFIKGRKYRLPTEAEWEYAARAGTTTAFANGDITETGCEYDPNLDAMGWYCGNSGVTYKGCIDATRREGSSCAGTHPVAQKQPNAWGLYDMHGNVWEWCQDWYWYDSYPSEPVTDPKGPDAGSARVYRGGSWTYDARYCRSADRDYAHPAKRYYDLGFRLSREAP